MKGIKLSTGQMIAIGGAITFGLPICIGLVVGHFLGFWLGVASSGLVLGFIGYLAQRWAKRTSKQQKED
jgi:uncharacterized membrane-anchored protein YhcB (DUF1043 family)